MVQYTAKADNHLSIESTSFLLVEVREIYLFSAEGYTIVRSLSVKRGEFSGSSKSNSVYSLHRIACLVLFER